MMIPLNIFFKRMQVAVLLIAVLFLNACKDSGKNDALIFEELNESLERSNKAIESSTINALQNLKEKSYQAETAEKARIWSLNANSVNEKSKEIIGFIDSLKNVIEKVNGQITIQSSQELYGKLKIAREFILNCDMLAKIKFETKIPLFNESFRNSFKDGTQLYITNFNRNSSLKIKSMLLKLENDVRNSENMIVLFCNDQIGMLDGPSMYEKFSAIVSQNSSHFRQGDEIKIKAGVGSFSTESRPKFIINNINIDANDGIALYKMRIKDKKGKYKIPVKINYTLQNGEHQVLSDYVEYTVDE